MAERAHPGASRAAQGASERPCWKGQNEDRHV